MNGNVNDSGGWDLSAGVFAWFWGRKIGIASLWIQLTALMLLCVGELVLAAMYAAMGCAVSALLQPGTSLWSGPGYGSDFSG